MSQREGDCPFNPKEFLRCYDYLTGIHTPLKSSEEFLFFIRECQLVDRHQFPLLWEGNTLWSTLHTLILFYAKKNNLKDHHKLHPDDFLCQIFGNGTFNNIKLKYPLFDDKNIDLYFIQNILSLNTLPLDIKDDEMRTNLIKEAQLLNTFYDQA